MLYGFELDKQVSLRKVYEVLESFKVGTTSTHEIDLGDAGYHDVECSNSSIEEIIREIGEM